MLCWYLFRFRPSGGAGGRGGGGGGLWGWGGLGGGVGGLGEEEGAGAREERVGA
jgi:hypothetical protein